MSAPELDASFELLRRGLQALSSTPPTLAEQVRPFTGLDHIPLGPTPYEVAYTKDRIRLLRYTPQTRRFRTPILFVYSLINRYTILDFLPGRSLIAFMLEQGFPVYCIDWGTPGPSDHDLTWDDHVHRYLGRSVHNALKDSGAPDLFLFGYCMGGTLALTYTALSGEGVRGFVAQASPVDFSDPGKLTRWTRPDFFNVDAMIDAWGNLPPELMESGFRAMDPVGTYQKWADFAQRLHDQDYLVQFLAMEKWAGDNIPFPGELYRQYIRDLYQRNALKDGQMVVGGRKVDLSRISCPLLTIVADKDHIAPPASCEALNARVSSKDQTVFRFPCGHVGLSSSSKAPKAFWPRIAGWLAERAERQE